MANQQIDDILTWICSSKNLDDLRDNYNNWADKYEVDLGGVWQSVPLAAALMLSQHLENDQVKIIDLGAGTGLVGVALAKLGFKQITGIDLSPSMLAKAKEKDVYSSLVCCAIGDDVFGNLDKADAMIATGVFADAHAGSTELNIVGEKIEPGGILVFTARQSFLPKLQEVLEQPEWTLIDAKNLGVYEDPMYIFAYKINHKSR